MIRILLWRLWYEFFNGIKKLGFRGKDRYYFAFGGNLDPSVLTEREIDIKDASFWELRDFELVFDHQGPYDGAGFASSKKQQGKTVYGKVYRLSQIDVLRMHYFEAVPFLRKYRVVRANYKDGYSLFFYQTVHPKAGLLPTCEYKSNLLAGYSQAPHECQGFRNTLEDWPCISEPLPANEAHFLIRDYDRLGKYLRPILKGYDHAALWLFLKLYVAW